MPVADYVDSPRLLSPLNISMAVRQSNDDEAERLVRRSVNINNSSVSSANSTPSELKADHEGMHNCMKQFHDNKITKDNAWSMTLIDNFSTLIEKHHKTLKNFQIIGSTLDATSKIYGLRVDSVHMAVIRMSSGLGRFKPDQQNNNEDDAPDADNDRNTTIENADNETTAPKTRKKRVRKNVSTITKNKETLNAKLDSIPLPDPLFSKLNSIMGDVTSSNRLLLSILRTSNSSMKLTLDNHFWDSTECEPIEYKEDNTYESTDADLLEQSIQLNIPPKYKIRQQLSGYLITNTPIDDDEEELPQNNNNSYNQTQLDYAFDINAEVEVEPAGENYMMDYDLDDGVAGEADELTAEDRDALKQCKGLRRTTTMIEDLRPDDASKLEYSYRTYDNITQFWAGPSYWKFRKSRKLTMGSNTTAGTEVIRNVGATVRRKPNRMKVVPTFEEAENEPNEMADEAICLGLNKDENAFISEKSKGGQKFKKTNLYKRWDSKKLKLPTDMRLDPHLFETYLYMPSACTNLPNMTSATPQTQNDYDQGNPAPEEEDHDMDMAMDMDHPMDHEDDIGETIPPVEPNLDDPNAPAANINETVTEIGTTFEGAPQMVQKIDIQFAKRAKVIDMKQMKKCCLQSICKQCEKNALRQFIRPQAAPIEEQYKDGVASFSQIYSTLPKLLTKTMAENLTPSVAFYSILHLANEHRLRLYKSAKSDDPNVFLIRQIE